MVLQEKVNILIGNSGSNMVKIQNEVGNKYKVISVNVGALAVWLTTTARSAKKRKNSTYFARIIPMDVTWPRDSKMV
jgi:hypothetical protein